MPISELKLAKELIRRPSVTPKDAGTINLLAKKFTLFFIFLDAEISFLE